MNYLSFELSDGGDGVSTLEAMASTRAHQQAAVMAEVQQVLDWAWRHFPHTHGPAEDGMDWNHELQCQQEDDGWHSVTLTLTGTDAFVAQFLAAFGPLAGDGEP